MVQNYSAVASTNRTTIRDNLLRQLVSPVRWSGSVGTMAAAGTKTFVECGPGNVLAGLARRIDRSLSVHGIGTLDGLESAPRELPGTVTMSEEKKVALVTGASRGIGKAIAARLAAEQLFVVGTATSSEGASAVANELGAGGSGMVLRLEDDAVVAETVAEIQSRYGAPLVLVNNAGVTHDNLLLRMTPEQWSEVVDANLTGIYRLTRPLLRGMMRARWGRIVNLSSVVARMGNVGQANYAATKAGIEGFTRSLAQEIGSRNITVNAVAPGFIDTDMTRELAESQRQAMVDRTALGRMGTAEDVAGVVAFLVSEAAGYITGETVHVNGGLYAG